MKTCQCDPRTPVLGRMPDGRMRCARCRGARRLRQQVGFVVTPDEIKDRIASLDTAVAKLDGDVRASSSTKLSAAWRTEWDAFVRRWTLERDSYASWGSRLFATRVMPRLDQFVANYQWWARDYQAKTGQRAPVAPPAKVETLTASSFVPSEVWWIVGAAALAYVFLTAPRRGGA